MGAGAEGGAAEGVGAAGIDAPDLTTTRTVEQHLAELAKDGTLAQPDADGPQAIQNIMEAVDPVADPGGVPGALRWDAPGAMNASSGTSELVVDPSTNTIRHLLFRGL